MIAPLMQPLASAAPTLPKVRRARAEAVAMIRMVVSRLMWEKNNHRPAPFPPGRRRPARTGASRIRSGLALPVFAGRRAIRRFNP